MVVLEMGDRPFIVSCIPLSRHSLIAAYHAELMNRAKRLTMYWEVECDRALFAAFEGHYQAIAHQFPEPFDPADLTPVSRHQFFIASEPVPHPTQDGMTLPGLSQIEQLLGMEYSASVEPVVDMGGIPPIPKAEITTGDRILDLITDAYLVFGDAASDIVDRFDAGAIARMITHKLDRQRGKEALEEKQSQLDKDWFIKHELALMRLAAQRRASDGVGNG